MSPLPIGATAVLLCWLMLTVALVLFTWLQILCPHSSVMDPLFPDAQRSLCQTWGPLPTLWHPTGSPWCLATRVFSVPLCRGPLMRWPAERAIACQHLHTCLAVWETCPTSTEAPHSPSSQTWAPCLRMETLPGIITHLNLTTTTSSTNSISSASPGGSRTAFLRTIDTMSIMNTTSKDFHDNTHPQLQADPLQVNMKCVLPLTFYSIGLDISPLQKHKQGVVTRNWKQERELQTRLTMNEITPARFFRFVFGGRF